MTTPLLPPSFPRARSRALRRILPALVLVALMTLVPAVFAIAQAQEGWTQFQGGPDHSGDAPGGPEPAYRMDWELPIDLGGPDLQFGVSAPVVAGDTIVVVGPDQIIGVDAESGSQAWTVDRDLGPPVSAAIASVDGSDAVVYTEGFGDGPPDPDASPSASSPSPTAPASASPSGSAAGEDGADGQGTFNSHLAAFDVRTRKPLFKPVPLDEVSRTGVTVDGTMAFVGANGGRVYAIDLTDGSVVWNVELGRPLTSPPTVAADTVLVGVQSTQSSRLPTVVALDAGDGEEAWRLDDQGAAAIVSTVAANDTTAYVAFSGSQEASIDAIDLATGERTWRSRLPRLLDPSATAPPVVTDDAVYATDALGVTYAFDPDTGARIWDFALNQNVFRAAPIAVADHVVVGTLDGDFVALDASSGELVWRSEATAAPVRAMAVAGERLVLVRGGADAGLQAYVHDPDGTLVSEPSPTTPDPGMLALNVGIAGAVVIGLTLLLGRFLAKRMGPALPDTADSHEDEDEISDDIDNHSDEDERDQP
ncbi:MAG TPA: PQQ-binding-like beta-propeller repeat protein [Actinomycetota bacterium]